MTSKETINMERSSHKDDAGLGHYLQQRRREAGFTVRGLARAAGIDATGISRLEHGENEAPLPETLAKLARVLEVDVNDLYVLAGYQTSLYLPSFQPYLRERYNLSTEAVDQLASIFDLILERDLRQRGGHDDDGNSSTP
jgi:transcriptional regulator with XRE-family HTH domain